MDLKDQIQLLSRLHFLIEHHATGTPVQLASKLGLSERMVYHYVNLLKSEFEAPIVYSRTLQSYIYTEQVDFQIGFKKKMKRTILLMEFSKLLKSMNFLTV